MSHLNLDMMQYALNDSKIVIYIFFLIFGLFDFFKKELTIDKLIKSYYEVLVLRFIEGRESQEKRKTKESNFMLHQYIIIQAYENCLCNIKDWQNYTKKLKN